MTTERADIGCHMVLVGNWQRDSWQLPITAKSRTSRYWQRTPEKPLPGLCKLLNLSQLATGRTPYIKKGPSPIGPSLPVVR